MTLDGNAGTAPETPEAQPVAGTSTTPDEVTTLRSRNAGLDAKVTELLRTAADAEAKATAAEARALVLAQAKEGGDAELREELRKAQAAIVSKEAEAKLARIEARYPETYQVLGEAASALTDDVLAASEARFKGVAANEPPETPYPVGANPVRTPAQGNKSIEDMSLAELRKHLGTFDSSAFGLSAD